jgi:hypothetical protein
MVDCRRLSEEADKAPERFMWYISLLIAIIVAVLGLRANKANSNLRAHVFMDDCWSESE